MMRPLFFPGLLDTGSLSDRLLAVRDGFVNIFIIRTPAGLVCIDTGWSQSGVLRGFRELGLNVRDVAAVLLTHAHWDHARCLALYPRAELFVGERDVPLLKAGWRSPAQAVTTVRDGQALMAAGLAVQVIDTPGHTPGAVSFLVERRFLFTGDALRLRRGRALPFYSVFNRDGAAVRRSIHRLALIDGVERLLTAHSGIASDPADALRRWRGAGQEGRQT